MHSAAELVTEHCDGKSVCPVAFVFSPSLQTDPTLRPRKQTTGLLSYDFPTDVTSCGPHCGAVIIASGPLAIDSLYSESTRHLVPQKTEKTTCINTIL